MPDCHNLPGQLDKGPGGAQSLANGSPSVFFIYMPQSWAHGKGEDVNLSGTTSVYFSS